MIILYLLMHLVICSVHDTEESQRAARGAEVIVVGRGRGVNL